MSDLDQKTLRRLYDALRVDFLSIDIGNAYGHGDMFQHGLRAGVNRAIDVLVKLNDGYAPAEPDRSKADG